MKERVQGIGIDIIETERIQKAISRHGNRFLNRVFTIQEQLYCKKHINHFAGRFAAKEAVLKALGTGLSESIGWKEIEIRNDLQGKPEVYLSPKLQNLFPGCRFLISISHSDNYAAATALMIACH